MGDFFTHAGETSFLIYSRDEATKLVTLSVRLLVLGHCFFELSDLLGANTALFFLGKLEEVEPF